MAKKEDVPTSLMQKSAAARTSLDKNASSHDASPPRTPPSQISRVGRGKGAGAREPRNRPVVQDTFGDSSVDVEAQHRRARSNSHDLSWSPKNTRDSVVDNMLLSLDQFSSDPTLSRGIPMVQSPFDQIDPYASVQRSGLVNGRPRGHTFSSSISSDPSFYADSPKSSQTRGHRSNSSTNFQPNLGRIDSIRHGREDSTVGGDGQKFEALDKGDYTSPSPGRGSGSSSLDFGQMMAGSRWQRAAERRSSSFDYGYRRPLITRQNTSPPCTSDPNQEHPFIYDDVDAAPTPTIPVGPRRNHSPSPATRLRPDSSLSQIPQPRRRGSIRSPMAYFSRGERVDHSRHTDSRIDPRLHTRGNSQDIHSSSLAPDMTPAKRRAVSSPLASTPTSADAAKDKDRPGFFKRVFGSSRGAMASQTESPAQKKGSSHNNFRAGSRIGTTLAEAPSNAKSREAGMSGPLLQKESAKEKRFMKEQRPQTLNKKTSFFRRRRKSVFESARPPLPQESPQSQMRNLVMLPAAQTTMPSEQTPSSPVSSLRQVMNAYLDSSARPEGVKDARSFDMTGREAIRRGSFAKSTIRAIDASEGSEMHLPSFPDFRPTAESHLPQPPSQSTPGSKESIPPTAPAQRRVETDRLQHHHRTQSDMDKDLPRLPVDYKAFDKPKDGVPGPSIGQSSAEAEATKVKSSSDDPVLVTTSGKTKASSEKSPRVWLQSRNSEEDGRIPTSEPSSDVQAAAESGRTSASTLSDYKSANSKSQSPNLGAVASSNAMDVPEHEERQQLSLQDASEPSQEDRMVSQKLFLGEGDVRQSNIAAWLGEEGPERGRVRRAYMELFDWKDMSILTALRDFCGHLVLKGETQQVDRVLDALSVRWCGCNPNHGFKASGKTHLSFEEIWLTSSS